MMSDASKGTPGPMRDPVLANDGFWSLLRRKSSSVLPPLVGMCQYAETLLSLLFRRCLGITRGCGTGGMGNLGDMLYWNGGDIGIVPMLLLRRRSVDIDKFGGVEANRSWNEFPDCVEKLLPLRCKDDADPVALSKRPLISPVCMAGGLPWNKGCGTILMCSPTAASELVL